jgi:endonuclease III
MIPEGRENRMAASAKKPTGAKPPVRKLLNALAKAYPDAVCALHHESPFQLLVATILSAQCTDARVNLVTPALFRKYPGPKELSTARLEDLETLIRSTGFYHAKAVSLIGMAKGVMEQHGGELPRTLEELIKLPGVGRKTANVLLGTAFGLASGVVVDTHVTRLSHRLGLTKATSAHQIERDLMELIPRKEWVDFSHRLIHHGRQICVARKPRCLECPLLKLCPRVGLPPLPS